jgi:hypothetical protein
MASSPENKGARRKAEEAPQEAQFVSAELRFRKDIGEPPKSGNISKLPEKKRAQVLQKLKAYEAEAGRRSKQENEQEQVDAAHAAYKDELIEERKRRESRFITVDQYRVLPELEKRKAPKPLSLGKLKKMSPDKYRKAMQQYDAEEHAYIDYENAKKRRKLAREEMTKGGIFSVAYMEGARQVDKDIAGFREGVDRFFNKKPKKAGKVSFGKMLAFAAALVGATAELPSKDTANTPIATVPVEELLRADIHRTPIELGPISFEEARKYAEYASSVTHVRAELILGILAQESASGMHRGTCYLTDPNTGAGRVVLEDGSTVEVDNVMNPGRDAQAFIYLTQALGRDPYATKVSHPLQFGYGGALGPAQILPSVWLHYNDEIRQFALTSTGAVADFDDPQQAILAIALILRDNGAAEGTADAEQRAVGLYYAGAGWETEGRDYIHGVMNHARDVKIKFEEQDRLAARNLERT